MYITLYNQPVFNTNEITDSTRELLIDLQSIRKLSVEMLIAEILIESLEFNDSTKHDVSIITTEAGEKKYDFALPILLSDSSIPKPHYATAFAWACSCTRDLTDPLLSEFELPGISMDINLNPATDPIGAKVIHPLLWDDDEDVFDHGIRQTTYHKSRVECSTGHLLAQHLFLYTLFPHAGMVCDSSHNAMAMSLRSMYIAPLVDDTILNKLITLILSIYPLTARTGCVDLELFRKRHPFGVPANNLIQQFPYAGPFASTNANHMQWHKYHGIYMRFTHTNGYGRNPHIHAWNDAYRKAQGQMTRFMLNAWEIGRRHRLLEDFIESTTIHRHGLVNKLEETIDRLAIDKAPLEGKTKAQKLAMVPILEAFNKFNLNRL